MAGAGYEADNGTLPDIGRKRVHFDEKQSARAKNFSKKWRKGTKAFNSKLHGGETSNKASKISKKSSKEEDDILGDMLDKGERHKNSLPKLSKTQGRRGSIIATPNPPKRSRRWSLAMKKSPAELKGANKDGAISDKNPEDGKKKWPFVDFKEQLKMDIFDVARLSMGHNIVNQNTPSKSKSFEANLLQNFLGKASSQKRRPSSNSGLTNFETMDVLSSVQQQQKKRHQESIKADLTAIHERVKKALKKADMESDSEEEDTGGTAGGVKLPPINTFDFSAERKKMEERNYILGRMDTYEEKAIVKTQYLTELTFWFEDHLNMCSDITTPEEMKELVATTQQLHKVISQSLTAFVIAGEQVVEKGKLLLQETGKIIEERKALMSKKTKKERIVIYDEKTLLSDPQKWDSATKTIISVFEDCHKMIKNLMFKNALRLCQKQFENMMDACDKRLKEVEEKKKQCMELHGKVQLSKIQNDKLNKEIDEQKKKYAKLLQELMDTKSALDKLQEKNTSMKANIVELNYKLKNLTDELRIKNKTPTPPPTPPPPPEPEKIYVKIADSAIELRLEEVEVELEAAKEENETLTVQLDEVSEQLQTEQEKSQQLQVKVQELEKLDDLGPIEIPEPEVKKPIEIPEGNSYYRTLMTGMKRDFEIEMEKVKSHLRKEKTRGEASMKKMEIQHKDQISYIQKDTVRMLRGIVHFREHMLTCLEKENLIDQAQALQDLGDVYKDKFSQDPKEVLATVASSVVDYLNKMEGVLSNSFLAMRILMKYQIEKQVEMEVQQRLALREVQTKDKEVKGTKKNVSKLAKSLKKAKNKLKKAKAETDNVHSDKRYLALLSRYNAINKLYKNMQTEMEVLQSDFHDTMQRKLEEKETMVISKVKMDMKKKKSIAEEQLKLSIADQRRNLQMLGKAYEDNKISKELHTMATAMIQKTMDIPRRKLRHLFEQYITFRTIEDSKARVSRVLHDENVNLTMETRREMVQYVGNMDDKFTNSMKNWRGEMENLEVEKKDLNKKIFKLFNEVLIETGMLFVHPLLRDQEKSCTMSRAASQMSRDRVNKILFKKKTICKEFLCMPHELQGTAVRLGQGDNNKFFKYRRRRSIVSREPVTEGEQSSDTDPGIVLPHMMAYEVNKSRIRASRSLQGGRTCLQLGKTESFNINHQNFIQFLRDTPLQRTGFFQNIPVQQPNTPVSLTDIHDIQIHHPELKPLSFG